MLPPDRRQACSKYSGFQEFHFLKLFRNFQRTEHCASICSKILCDHFLGEKTQIYYLNCEVRKLLFEMESASSDSVPVDDIKDLLTCSLCSRTLNDPKSLPCLHNFCKSCLGEFICLICWKIDDLGEGILIMYLCLRTLKTIDFYRIYIKK